MAKIKLLKHGVPVRFSQESEAPASPENGMIYYDTSSDQFKVYENGQWQILSSTTYANRVSAGFDIKETCRAASASNITGTYANGTSGVGATITGSGALSAVDGITLSVGDRVLLFGQTSALQNGIYKLTTLSPFVLTRTTDFDSSTEVNGGEYFFIKSGTNYGSGAFVCTNSGPATIGTTSITFTQVSGTARSLQQYYGTGNQITTAAGNNVVVDGTETLEITASGGVEITNALTAGATVLTSASASSLAAGAGKLAINTGGNITSINNVAVSFPTSASQSNYALTNSTGTLNFSNLAVSNLNDVSLSNLSSESMLRYNGSSFEVQNPVSSISDVVPLVEVLSKGLLSTDLSSLPNSVGAQDFKDTSWPNPRSLGWSAGCMFYIDQPTKFSKIDIWLNALDGGDDNYRIALFQVNDATWFPSNYRTFIGATQGAEVATTAEFTRSSVLIPWGPYTWSNTKSWPMRTYNFTTKPTLQPGVYVWAVIASSGTMSKYAMYLSTYGSSAYNGPSTYSTGGVMDIFSLQWATGVGNSFNIFTGSENVLFNLYSETGGVEAPTTILKTNASGLLDSSLIRTNINLGNNILSGLAEPTVSTDIVNKSYVDVVTLQTIYNQAEGDATITTTTVDGAVVIAGTEKLLVSASSGVSTNILTVSAGSMAAGSLVVGNGSMSVSLVGNLEKISGISYAFPASQAAGSNYVLTNDGSGSLTWVSLETGQMSDVINSNASVGDKILQFNGTEFINESLVLSGGNGSILMCSTSGRLGSGAVQYNIDFIGHSLTNLGTPLSNSDAVPKAYADAQSTGGIGSVTLQTVYENGPVLTTNSVDGSLIIEGTESLKLGGFLLADNNDPTKYSQVVYKHEISLAANQSAMAIPELTFSSSSFQGCSIEYRIKDAEGQTRMGTILVSTDGTNTSISDSFAETAPVGLTWGSGMVDQNVEVRYTSNSSSKLMSAKIKLFK